MFNSYWLMKLELLSLLTKIPVCEIYVCHLYNT